MEELPDYAQTAIYHERRGFNTAKNLVADLCRELSAAGNQEWSTEIHDLVWRMLRDKEDEVTQAAEACWRTAIAATEG